ncbi:hypothetical protein RF11_02378 [Thelohanellus kitauei]|uniref:Uncharacterized protein n=1 Tax=Thelohanellus kitauei TaxID=669202 RepID=A0A0C2IGU7_THEKT|nr:hypothetical protein RF11_02378 [Thelohanellus kitauei]
MNVKSLDQIHVNGYYMWVVSKLYKKAFYIDENLAIRSAESLEDNTEYMVHPSNTAMVMKYTIDGNGLKIGYVRKYHGYKKRSFSFQKMDFIFETGRYVYISPDNTFNDFDDTDESIKFTKPGVSDFRNDKYHILLIESSESTKNLDISVYDEVKMFKVVENEFYLILVHNDKMSCLWVSTETRFKLGRTICTNNASEFMVQSYLHFDKKLRNQIFLNYPNQEYKQQTLRSSNKGRVWYEMKFRNPNDSQYSIPVLFKFGLYDRRDVMKNFFEIDIQYTESANGRIPFITYDNGMSWIATPITNSRLVMLNDGMVLVSVHTDTNEINYNVDKGKNTWFRAKLFENQPRVLYI